MYVCALFGHAHYTHTWDTLRFQRTVYGMWTSLRVQRDRLKAWGQVPFSMKLSCWPSIPYQQFITFDWKMFMDLFKTRSINSFCENNEHFHLITKAVFKGISVSLALSIVLYSNINTLSACSCVRKVRMCHSTAKSSKRHLYHSFKGLASIVGGSGERIVKGWYGKEWPSVFLSALNSHCSHGLRIWVWLLWVGAVASARHGWRRDSGDSNENFQIEEQVHDMYEEFCDFYRYVIGLPL